MPGERVELAGWIHAKRDLGSVSFVVLRDRGGLAQLVLDRPLEVELETVVEVDGVVAEALQAPGGVEVREPRFRVLAEPAGPPPVELRRPELKEQLPTILDHAPVSLRHPRRRAAFEIAAAAVAGFRETLDAQGFVEIHSPKIVATATESGANVFRLDYFGRDAFLAQSPQFYKQTMVGVFERVYEVGPVFRGEPHDTTRHLAEYTSLDAELGFVEDHFDVMRVLRDVVAGMVAAVGERAAGAVDLLGVRLPDVPAEIPWVHFADTGVDDVDLAPADERRLCEEHGELLFVTGYPMEKRPFYTHPEPGRPEYSNSLRPALPRPRARHRRAAAAPPRRLRRRARRPHRGLRGLPRGLPPRHAAARRLRDRARALRRPAPRRAERPRDDALPARPDEADTVKAGLLGAGNVAHYYRDGLADSRLVEIVAVADRDPARGIPPEQLLADPEIELVVNLTPAVAHAETSRAALEAGKHVFSEKPLAMTLAEGEGLAALARERGLGLAVAPDTFLGPSIRPPARSSTPARSAGPSARSRLSSPPGASAGTRTRTTSSPPGRSTTRASTT